MSSEKRKDPILSDEYIKKIPDTMTEFKFELNCYMGVRKSLFELKGTKLLCQLEVSLGTNTGTLTLGFISDYKSFCVTKPRFKEVFVYNYYNALVNNVVIKKESATFRDKSFPVTNGVYIRYITVTVVYKTKCYECIYDKNVTLLSQMKDIYLDEKFADVIINVEGEKFPAHKVILVSNPVFAAMLQNDMVESKTNVICIREMDPAIFQIILRFIYFGNTDRINLMELGEDFLINLIMAADMYQILYLKEELINIAINYIHLENVIKLFILSDKFNISKLKEECMLFINSSRMEVVDTSSFQELIKEHVYLASELLVYMMKNHSS